MKLIDKSALVAEIERRRNECINSLMTEQVHTLSDMLDFLDTLEVKEVDLEEEVDKWYNNKASKEFENVLYKDIEKCAKYFFELGIKAQKGE